MVARIELHPFKLLPVTVPPVGMVTTASNSWTLKVVLYLGKFVSNQVQTLVYIYIYIYIYIHIHKKDHVRSLKIL